MQKSSQNGQVLLIIVLVMVVALTVGLALAARSVINLKNTNEEANSQKAFQAAEAGVEIALAKPLSNNDQTIGTKTLSNNAVIQSVTIHSLSGSSILLSNGDPLIQDEGLDVWLTNYPDYSGSTWTGKIYMYWGTTNACNDAAMEAIVISGTSPTDTNAKIYRYGIDGCGVTGIDTTKNRRGSNNFAAASAGGAVNGKTFTLSTAISVQNGILMRLIPLYASTPVAIVGYTNAATPTLQNFPAQGRLITSVGLFGTTQREVSFFQGYPLLPSEFYYTEFQR